MINQSQNNTQRKTWTEIHRMKNGSAENNTDNDDRQPGIFVDRVKKFCNPAKQSFFTKRRQKTHDDQSQNIIPDIV